MQEAKKNLKIKKVKREKKDVAKGVNTLQYCGVLQLIGDPLQLQKNMRDEWR